MGNYTAEKSIILGVANETLIVRPKRVVKPYFRSLDKRPSSLMQITHEVPVTFPVKRYLDYWMPAPYQARNSDFLGMWLIGAMARKTVQVKVLSIAEMREKGYVHSWQFTMPGKYDDRLLLPRHRAYELNAIIRKMMYMELIADMDALRAQGTANYMQAALNNFRDRYGLLEKDLHDERVKRMYHRHHERSNTLQAEMRKFWPGMLLGKIDLRGTKIYRKD